MHDSKNIHHASPADATKAEQHAAGRAAMREQVRLSLMAMRAAGVKTSTPRVRVDADRSRGNA